ncbi:P-loop containing nucleoside triphosphate hydrolase protein [Aspergillus varians]
MQQPAMQAIQDGASPILIVMPTGSGKSMLFMLPAFIATRGYTIIVVPLLALRSDLQQQCQQLGIQCMSWESRMLPDKAAIIVVDECHVILNQQQAFRPAMARLGHLVEARMQLVFLTAILPPSQEGLFFHQAQALSQELGCEAYHSGTMDCGGVLQQFMNRVTWVIIATSTLGIGLDIPDIWCIMHMGRPRTLLDYGQESGRAGQDGLASKAVIIQPSR